MTDRLIVSDARLALAAYRAKFPADEIPMAVAIALAESDGDAHAKSTNTSTSSAPGSHDLGAWQINDFYHADLLRKHDWRDVDQNSVMAKSIFADAGNSWGPWSTYHSERYAQYLARGRQAYATLFSWTLARFLMLHPHGDLDAGPDVAQLQRALGMTGVDGVFGQHTDDHVRAFQRDESITVDGVVGAQTCAKLGWHWRGPR